MWQERSGRTGVDKMKICMLGASFDTGNLGVSALAEGSIKAILGRWPDTEISFIGCGQKPDVCQKEIGRQIVTITSWPLRFSPKLFVANHFLSVVFWGIVRRVVPRAWAMQIDTRFKGIVGAISRCDLVVDLTGGDSFSDIYGLRRLILNFLCKRIMKVYGKPLVLMPQTYGPFDSRIGRFVARDILSWSAVVMSRDTDSIGEIEMLMAGRPMLAVPKLCPDVAFVLDAVRRETEQAKHLEQLKAEGKTLIGLNVSGLLYNGGYTGRNEFGLKCDYRRVVLEVARRFAAKDNHVIVLVPHVLPRNFPVENDLEACKALVQSLPAETRPKVIVLDGTYDQSEVKYLIGLCDFFMGARMHSTIAALSQSVPAVAMAYSRKFAGVFQTAGVEDCVVDMRMLSDEGIVQKITEIYANRDAVRARLEKIVPHIKRQVHKMFDDLVTSHQEGDKAAVRGQDVRKAV